MINHPSWGRIARYDGRSGVAASSGLRYSISQPRARLGDARSGPGLHLRNGWASRPIS